jgi:hypothetical protein
MQGRACRCLSESHPGALARAEHSASQSGRGLWRGASSPLYFVPTGKTLFRIMKHAKGCSTPKSAPSPGSRKSQNGLHWGRYRPRLGRLGPPSMSAFLPLEGAKRTSVCEFERSRFMSARPISIFCHYANIAWMAPFHASREMMQLQALPSSCQQTILSDQVPPSALHPRLAPAARCRCNDCAHFG